MRKRSIVLVGIHLLYLVWALPILAQVQISTDRPSQLYQVGETATFQIRATTAGTYAYEIYYDAHTPLLETDSISLTANQVYNIPYQASKAGVVLCRISGSAATAVAAAAFSPFDIAPLENAPDDFDQYWNTQKNLVDQVGISLKLDLHKYNTYSTTYAFSLPNIEGRQVSGYMTLPSGNGPYPATVLFPDFGTAPESLEVQEALAEIGGTITFSLSIHNTSVKQEDPNAYQPNDPTNREQIYYRYALTGAINVINYLHTRPDFDQQNICAMGVGQGGGLATLLAGIDNRVNLLIHSNAALNEHQGHKYQQASGFPNYLSDSLLDNSGEDIYQTTANAIKYYDAVYASQRFEGTSYSLIGLKNEVIPAATTLASYNQLKGEKIVLLSMNGGNEPTEEYWNERYDFINRHFQSKPSNPNIINKKGYHIDAQNPQQTTVGTAISLNAIVQLEDQYLDSLPSQWTTLSGPSIAIFSNAKSAATTATFSQAGEYLLRFQAQDNRKLNEAGKIYFLSDDVRITVEASPTENDSISSTISLDCPANQVIEIEATEQNVTVDWASPQAISSCLNSAVATTQVGGLANGSIFPLGTSLIQYEAVDVCNNSTSCNFTITINQPTPVLNLPMPVEEPSLPTGQTANTSTCLLQPQAIQMSNGKTVGGKIESLISGEGLSNEDLTAMHNTGNLYNGVWLGKGTTPVFMIDLGAVQFVDGMVLWNYAYHNWQVLKRRGIKDFSVSTSVDGITYSEEERFTATITTKSGKAEMAQRFPFSTEREVRFIRLKVLNAQNDASYVGLGEIRFSANCNQRNFSDALNARARATQNSTIKWTDKWSLFPNPSTGLLSISLSSNNTHPVDITIYNEVGKKVHAQKGVLNNTSLSLQHLSKGVYFVKIQNEKMVYPLEKIIIQ